MAMNAPRAWLITYDIADPRRLLRVHRFLKKRAVPVQYSVFLFEGSDAQIGRLMQQIEQLIRPDEDDVRAYQLPQTPQFDTLGRGSLPADSHLLSTRSPVLDGLLRAFHA